MPAGRSHTPKSIVTTNDAVVLIQSAGQHEDEVLNVEHLPGEARRGRWTQI